MSASTDPIELNKSLLIPGALDPDVCQNFSALHVPGLEGTELPDPKSVVDQITMQSGDLMQLGYLMHCSHDGAFLNRLQQFCLKARIKGCLNKSCVDLRRTVSPTVNCRWQAFREWIIEIAACHSTSNDQSRTTFTRLEVVAEALFSFSKGFLKQMAEEPLTEIKSEVCELLNWLAHVIPTKSEFVIESHISNESVMNALETARGLGICENRFWNLTVGNGSEKCIPALVQLAAGAKSDYSFDSRYKHLNHHGCSAEFCYFSDIDSTNVEQLHKCPDKNCQGLKFPLRDLEGEFWGNTWWLDDNKTEPYLAWKRDRGRYGDYVAISHVWSDGTGAGVQAAGSVNRCLFDYFKKAAKDLGCEAIWWDTISIPREPKARRKAIGKINDNFRAAKCTLVHDEYLVNFPWAEDGTPCLALVLSPWFTRAWTALELFSSEDVWVIFKGPKAENKQVIKNLKTDILAKGRISCSRGHFIASALIESLCNWRFEQISSIIGVLRTRYTSKPRDMVIIAGLLAGQQPSVDTPIYDIPAEITRNIVLEMQMIESSLLFHGHVTMTQKGGFSWCPFSLLSGPDLHSYGPRRADALVDKNGAVVAQFRFRILQPEDHCKLRPYSFHRSVDCKILAALGESKILLLLWQEDAESSRALLVQPLRISTLDFGWAALDAVDSRYGGTVNTDLKPDGRSKLFIRLGHVDNDSDITAEQILDKSFKRWGLKITNPKIFQPLSKDHQFLIMQITRQEEELIDEPIDESTRELLDKYPSILSKSSDESGDSHQLPGGEEGDVYGIKKLRPKWEHTSARLQELLDRTTHQEDDMFSIEKLQQMSKESPAKLQDLLDSISDL